MRTEPHHNLKLETEETRTRRVSIVTSLTACAVSGARFRSHCVPPRWANKLKHPAPHPEGEISV